MSGVIDADGTQWERCNGCINFVNIDDLLYEEPSEKFEYGRDLCRVCFLKAMTGQELTPDPAALEGIRKAKEDYDKSMEGKEYRFGPTKVMANGVEVTEVQIVEVGA